VLDQVISLGWGVLSFSREKAEKLVEEMIKKGELSKENGKNILKFLVERGARERADFKENINNIIFNLVQKGIFVTRTEFTKLEERINKIEESTNKENNKISEGNGEKGL
jgi:polyhydroxyalkanoate synthesis regulator phasin